MHDITNENKFKAGWDVATKLGGKALDAINPFQKKGFSNPADAARAKNVKTSASVGDDIAKLQQSKLDAVRSDKFTPDQLADIDRKIDNLKMTQNQIDTANFGTRTGKGGVKVPNVPTTVPTPDKFTTSQQVVRKGTLPALATGGIEGGYRYASGSEENPSGDSLIGIGADYVGQGARALVKAPFQAAASAMTDPDAVNNSSKETEADTDTSYLKKESLSENLSDILKLAGTKSITSRDNTSGLTKVKEVTKLNESKQIDECGMGMPSNSSTPATLSINATASSGEEVANMLKSIMDLAGVKPVTADMLGGQMAPMPMVKAIDIISKGEPDRMNDVGDKEMVSEPITIVPKGSDKTPTTDQTTGPNAPDIEKPINDNYSNTPEDPTDVPKYDPEKMVFRPNQPGQGDRMDGTMPKGNPGLGEGLAQSLLKEYEAFKNGQ